MDRRRRREKPAGASATSDVVDDNPQLFSRRLDVRRVASLVLVNLLSVVLLSASFAPFDAWYLAYVAFVPWLLALACFSNRRLAVLCATGAGVVFWAANVYWMSWITLPGYIASVVYLSMYWLAAALVMRSAMQRTWPTWLVFPIVWVAMEYARNYVISGFPWLFLGHSQYAQSRLIQITDTTGQYGVSFLVAMVNGTVMDLLSSPLFVRGRDGPRLRVGAWVGVGACVLVVGGCLGYGSWRVGQDTRTPGPVIGLVQQAYPISLTAKSEETQVIFDTHVRATEGFIGAGCDVVIWPESMLPDLLNAEAASLDLASLSGDDLRGVLAFWDEKVPSQKLSDYLREQLVLRGQNRQALASLSKKIAGAVLGGGPTLHRNDEPLNRYDHWFHRNSAMLFDGGPLPVAEYSKVHLVPFGEYVPFRQAWPGLYNLLRSFVPLEMPQIEPGREFRTFEIRRGGQTWQIASPICFEGTFDRVCRAMVMRNGTKCVDVLANMSNDGWFVWDGAGSTEHSQHLVQYCFRAIENRVPVVRAVNTGISASIDSNGRICAVIEKGGHRAMATGTMLLKDAPVQAGPYQSGPQVLVDTRVSLYSRCGDIFAMAVSAAAVGIVAVLMWQRRRAAKLLQKRDNT